MPRTLVVSGTKTAPDKPPARTQITLCVEDDGSITALVKAPLDSGEVFQVVRPADLNATQNTRASKTVEDMYDQAMKLLGFTSA